MLAMRNPQYVELAKNVYGYSMEQLNRLSLENYLVSNLLPVTIGNIIGGIICVGAPVFYLNMNKEEKKNVIAYNKIPADSVR